MIPYLCAFILGLGLLFLIGVGPALALEPGLQRRPGAPLLGLAPVLGLALVVTLAGLIAEFGQPLGPWVWPGTAGLLALSALLLIWQLRREPFTQPVGAGAWFWWGWLALGLALLLPAALGGLSWIMGNQFGGDTFNYTGLAITYEQMGWKAIAARPMEWVADHHMVMVRARNLQDRLGTPFLIGWQAHWGGVQPLLWNWYQALQGPLLAWPLCFSWLRRLRLKPWAAALASFCALAGFWVLLAQSISAFSYLLALPFMGALLFLAANVDRSRRQRWGRWILGGLLLHALLLVYSEMVVLLALVVLSGAFFARRARAWLQAWGAIALVALLVDPPMALYHLHFIWEQVLIHTGTPQGDTQRIAKGFSQAYVWLGQAPDWSRPFRALWGYWPAPVSWGGWGQAWQVAGDFAGILALIGLLAGLRHLRGWRRPLLWLLALLALLPLAMGVLALPLTSSGVYGKLLTYGGPYLFLFLALATLSPHRGARRWNWTVWAVLPLMLGTVLNTFAWVPQLAGRDTLRAPFPYAGRRGIDGGAWHDELWPICAALDQHKDELLLVGTENLVINEWLLFSLPDQRLDYMGTLSMDARTVGGRPRSALPRWLLMARDDLAGGDLHSLPAPMVYTHHYALFRLGPGDLERFHRYMFKLNGYWSTYSDLAPSIVEYRIFGDGHLRLRVTLTPTHNTPESLRICLRLDRTQPLLDWTDLSQSRSVIFTPAPGVTRMDVVVPKGLSVFAKVKVLVEPYPPAGRGRP